MADIAKTAKKISALPGAVTIPINAGGSGNLGDTAIIATDGDAEVADGSAGPGAYARGIVTSISGGKTTFVAGDRLSLTVFGPVSGFAAMTPADVLYQSDTAGALGEAAGTVSHKVGWAQTATIFFVDPDKEA